LSAAVPGVESILRTFAGPIRIAASIIVASLAAGATGEVRDFYNVIAPGGADPWVCRHEDGFYYATVTTGRDVTILRARTLSGLGGGERKVAWRPTGSGPASDNIWAPELHRFDGKWYVYFAADDGENANHRMYALENASVDPFQGKFVLKGKVADPGSDRWAIDGTAFRHGGRLYFLWSGWEGTDDVHQGLYIAPMANPWTLAGARVEISRPTLDWETRGGPPAVNEGPQVLIKGGAVSVVFSAGASWTDHYCLGLLQARAGGDLLDPATWSKRPEPVFAGGNGVVGPGHGSFTRSPDGREDWIVYHAARRPGSGWNRHLRIQPFGWLADGTPHFGQPAHPDRPIALPGGEPARLRIEAEAAGLRGTVRGVSRTGASGGGLVAGLDDPGDAVEFDLPAGASGTHHIAVRFGNDTPGGVVASQVVSVNDGPPVAVRYPHFGPGRWSSVVVPVELRAGPNRVRFARGRGVAELDCLDFIPPTPLGR